MKIEEIKNTCTGCGACESVCPYECVKLEYDNEGFYYPVINKNTCVKCGKCEQNCHIINYSLPQVHKTSYYGFTKNNKLRYESTSGGAFSSIAQTVLDVGGKVYGASFDYKDNTLKHCSNEEVGMAALRKSKYIESYMGDTIKRIQSDIDNGRMVMFCGTPCQVAGVKYCVKDENNLLITMDFICHGVPSSEIFKEHIKHIHRNEKLIGIDFRPKERGWTNKYIKTITMTRTREKPLSCDTFYYGFMTKNAFLRKSCYDCKYRQLHYSDITIADFWGYRSINTQLNDEKGLSLIIANNDIGKNIIENLKDFELSKIDNKFSDYAYADKDYSEFAKIRHIFYNNYKKYGFEKAAKKTYMKDYFVRNVKYYLKRLLGRD